MISKPMVTLGVCVRNSAATIRQAIESIMNQDFPHELMEVIFVDDGSSDATLHIIVDYSSRMDIRAKVLHQEWKGLGPSRNVIVNNASGDYIVWVDADMILPRDHVRKQAEFMDRNPRVGVAKARYGMASQEGTVGALENIPFVLDDIGNKPLNSRLPGTGGAIFRIKAIRQVSGFDDHMTGVGEDQDIAYRVKSAGWSIERSNAFFIERREEDWNSLWRKYVWYGYGNYRLHSKNRNIFKVYRMIPPAAFLAGLSYAILAYQMMHLKMTFLLPLHFVFKSSAWCWGFTKAAWSKEGIKQ